MASEAANAEKAEIAAADASLEEAIKRRADKKTGAAISAASVAPPVPVEEADAETDDVQKQASLKLGSVLSSTTVTLSAVKQRIKKLQDVSFGD